MNQNTPDQQVVPVLATARLTLRPYDSPSDDKALYSVFSDPEAMRYFAFLPLTDPAQLPERVTWQSDLVDSGEGFVWAIEQQRQAGLMGTITLFQLDRENRRAEIGFIIGRDFWGRGYAGEALRKVTEYAFTELGLHRLEADVDPRNLASLKLLEGQGFKREGYLPDRWYVGEQWSDSILLGLINTESSDTST